MYQQQPYDEWTGAASRGRLEWTGYVDLWDGCLFSMMLLCSYGSGPALMSKPTIADADAQMLHCAVSAELGRVCCYA
jgi:hypothetical protein